MKEKIKISLPTAIGIALLPPAWAVLSSLCGIEFGWIALACAGIYVAAGDNVKNGLPISCGFLMGVIWGYVATKLLEINGINHNILLFLVLCIMGFFCVILSFTILEKIVFLPAWLGSWAIALGTFGQAGQNNLGIVFIKLLITMLVGVWYVGAFNSYFQSFIRKRMNKNE
ncbi:DUF1097 domain-containing protein [Clostridium sp. SHJSY1]|uniref:DUF1097 domain-containing protein n=1 Tax=Clostridium sp. SHJSY1 TaxID=2942483 RepID=UPI00287663F3|nr:DUF1097 domain-containing protein [Clostridium sp. SHJSY1]MDS0524196.1 DUF1097 domain-containing protein [Clostridium sp. SHJSY1]